MHLTLIHWLAIYFVAVLGFSLIKRTALPGRVGKTLQLFKAFLPSWRFFEDFDEAPTIYYRAADADQPLSDEWKVCMEKLPRKFRSIFYNPLGNTTLAAGSLVQQLLSDIESVDDSRPHDTEGLVSYQLAKHLVVFQLLNRDRTSEKARYQFKVSGESGDLLISPIYSIGEN